MKKILAALTIALVLFISACTKTCETGYEGKDCKTEIRVKYYGTYKGLMAQNSNSWTTYIEVGTMTSNTDEISIGGLNAKFENNNGDFYIPTQTVTVSGNPWNAYGTGVFDSNELTFNYYIERNGQVIQNYFSGIKD